MKQTTYKTFDELPLMLSVPDVAAVLGISRAGAYELVHAEDFPKLRIGNRIVVPKEEFRGWIQMKVKGGFEITRPKTETSIRKLALSPEVIEVLKAEHANE